MIKAQTTTENVNYSLSDQYVQASRDFGSTTFYNISTNTSTTVPWGALDWVNWSIGSIWSVLLTGGAVWFIGHMLKVW